jgi:hypothetical protein
LIQESEGKFIKYLITIGKGLKKNFKFYFIKEDGILSPYIEGISFLTEPQKE